MSRRVALALMLAGVAGPAAAEGGVIRGGEHDGFSRVVMVIEPATEWSLDTVEGRATIRFPGRRLDFDPGEVFARMPMTRVRAVRTGTDAAGTAIEIDLGCDCRVSASFVGARYLALDVGDRGLVAAGPPPETPAQREVRETEAIAAAEGLLVRQIERAAGQGLVTLTEGATTPAPRTADVAPVAASPLERLSLKPRARHRADPVLAPAPLDGEQIEATTVFDRDSRRARAAPDGAGAACLADAEVDVAAWSNGLSFTEQLPPLQRRLVGEFDAPDPLAVRDLARLYIRFGFGAEAETLLATFGGAAVVSETPLLTDLARVLDGAPAAEGGPLAHAGACPGAFGLWLALGGRAPVIQRPGDFAAVQAAFEALPPDLRGRLGPGFVGRLLDAGGLEEARLIQATTIRAGGPQDAPTRLAAARLLAAEGRTQEATQALVALAEAEDETATPALIALVALALDGGLPLPDRVMTDLRAAVVLGRGAEREAELRRLLVAALAARAELAAAVQEARVAMVVLPGAADEFGALAVQSIAAADPARVGAAAYAGAALGAADLVARMPARDPSRRAIARQLVALGLPEPALSMVAPALVLDDPAGRLIAAEIELARGAPAAARALVETLDGPEAAGLRARAFALGGDYPRARAAGGTDAYAFAAGDWTAALAAAGDPGQAALAGFMAGVPAAEGAALPPEAAFRAPLPPLDRPSLGAAQQLLDTGPQIGGLIEGLLDAPVPAAP